MAVQRVSRGFKDIDLSFSPHPITKDLQVLKNESAIRRAVRNIVETIPTEVPFDSLLGSDVRSSLFNFVDYGTAAQIRSQIEIAIKNYEPRVEKLKVDVDPRPDSNSFECTIVFDIIGQEIPTQTFTFILEANR